MIWIVPILLIYLAGFFYCFKLMKKKSSADDVQLQKNFSVINEEASFKENTLRDLAKLALGFTSMDYFTKLGQQIANIQDELRNERGRVTITEAELEAVDTRLRELEELKRELELSNVDSIREIELLKTQQTERAEANEKLKNEIATASGDIQQLNASLAGRTAVAEKLANLNGEFQGLEDKLGFYQTEIIELNERYIALKKAYDALDIEYAQLYEKQQAAAKAQAS